MISSVIEGGTGSLCFLRLSRYASVASRTFLIASARVVPWEMQPGSEGTSATNMPSSSCATITRYFNVDLRMFLRFVKQSYPNVSRIAMRRGWLPTHSFRRRAEEAAPAESLLLQRGSSVADGMQAHQVGQLEFRAEEWLAILYSIR